MTTIHPTMLVGGDSPSKSRSRAARGMFPAAGLFILVLLVSLSRSLFDPPGYDQAYYQYATERIMAGDNTHAIYWAFNAMGAYVPHYLATMLFGTGPWALRAFDACWELPAFALLVWFGGCDGRRWRVGWTAAVLYALVYYGSGFLHTAQRDAFAVLPLLLLARAVVAVDADAPGERPRRPMLALFVGGAAGAFAFALKPPLGACYGAVWLFMLAEALRHRRYGLAAFNNLVALTAGFTVTLLAAMTLLVHLGLWSSFGDALTMGGQMFPNYAQWPVVVRLLKPYTLPALLLGLGLVILLAKKVSDGAHCPAHGHWAQATGAMALIFGLLLLVHRKEEVRGPLVATLGVVIPATGAILCASWTGRSRTWRVCLLMAGGGLMAVFFQGWFLFYQMLPLYAFLCYLAADEIVRRVEQFDPSSEGPRAWTLTCLAALIHLALSHWGHYMTLTTRGPYVLSDVSLVEHYTRITKHQPRYPIYGTSARVADRIRSLTGEHEPIALLFREPRIYQLARRPPAHPLLVINEWTAPLFPDFLRTVKQVHPKVLVARLPASVRGKLDLQEVEAAVFADVESFFGPGSMFVREQYRLTEVINDIGILQPRSLAGNQNIAPCQSSITSSGGVNDVASAGCAHTDFGMTTAGAERAPLWKPSSQ